MVSDVTEIRNKIDLCSFGRSELRIPVVFITQSYYEELQQSLTRVQDETNSWVQMKIAAEERRRHDEL